ncbi:MAG: TonB-dependent receptor [Proteobacteria bacterium]|nr:TonB-dependent receptor [Pseudomonadota bacterium]
MSVSLRALACALLVHVPATAFAADNDGGSGEIVVTASRPEPAQPATRAVAEGERIATQVNAASVEDTLKYLPSLVVRKRHIGDNFAPIATRTSGLGASARSLIFADGALLSALIGNNNGNGSPRWTLVTPEEVERVEVLYGPFSAAYSGNSIGTVVNITTRMPDKLEARATVLTNQQTFDLYGTHRTLPTWQYSGSVGGRVGPVQLLASVTHTAANSQPISFTTLTGTVAAAPSHPTGTSGGYADLNKLGQQILVLGAGGLEHHVQDTFKLKARAEITTGVFLSYVLGIWTDSTTGAVETYQAGAGGSPSYLTANNTTAGFNSAAYTRDALHFSHVLSLTGSSPRIDWQVIGTAYHYAHDWQNNPSPDTGTVNGAITTSASTGFVATRNDLPGALLGGVGTTARQDGTGWATLDARASASIGSAQRISFGSHADRETLNAATSTVANWLDGNAAPGQIRAASHGNTRTVAVWVEDAIKLAPAVTLTLGGRQEWWRAWGGSNATLTATVKSTIVQPERQFSGFSPKASLEAQLGRGWSARASLGQAFRMPTVGELYQTTTVGTLLANPNPNLLPERARSAELALEHHDGHGFARLSLFNEVIDNALISQTGSFTPPGGGALVSASFVQNVDRTRARGVELAVDRRELVPHWDVAASLTYADAITSKDAAFPAAVGKLLPSVPHWKGSMVLTWHPTPRFSLTEGLRFVSRNFANLDNTDTVGNTYQGFYKYVVVDLRAQWRFNDRLTAAVGVDNLGNDKYFLFHPFPQRSWTAQLDWKW